MLILITKQPLKYRITLFCSVLFFLAHCGKSNSYSSCIGQQNEIAVENTLADSLKNPAAELYTQEVEQRFHHFLNGDNPLSYAEHNSKIYFVVSNIVNDEDFTFLKMYIVNNSSSKYTIDEIILMQVEDPLGGRKSSAILKSAYITPVKKQMPVDKSVNAKGRELIGMVIPLYTGIDNGNLIIQIFEENGSRNGKIEINAKDITRAKLYGQ